MNNFIQNLISRHIEPANLVEPKIRGMYEPAEPAEPAELPDASGIGPTSLHMLASNDRRPDLKNIALPGTDQQRAHTLPQTNEPHKPTGIFTDHHVRPNLPAEESVKTESPDLPMIYPEAGILPDTMPRIEPANRKGPSIEYSEGRKTVFEMHPILRPDPPSKTGSTEAPKVMPAIGTSEQKNTLLENDGMVKGAAYQSPVWLRDIKQISEQFTAPPPAPVIKVNIGRLEIRVHPPASLPVVRSTPPAPPRLTLEEYLKKQNGNSK